MILALSSYEAEYVAATTTACQGIWLARFIEEPLNEETISMKPIVDKESPISLSKNPMFHNRSKHIETKFHFMDKLGRKEDGAGLCKLTKSIGGIVHKGVGKIEV